MKNLLKTGGIGRKIRVLIAFSAAISVLSMVFDSGICYACDAEVMSLLLALHMALLASTYVNDKLLSVLIVTLLVFYVSRVGILQLDVGYYVYQDSIPSPAQMTEVLQILLFVSISLLAGCIAGSRIKAGGAEGNYRMFLFSDAIKDPSLYYKYILWLYIASKLVLLYLFVTSGVGVGIDRQVFDPLLLRAAKIARAFSFLGLFPVCWIMLKHPRGYERTLTILAIVLMFVGNIIAGSKAALIVSILPFILVYYVAEKRMPRKVLFYFSLILIFSVVVVFALMASIRRYLALSLAGNPISFSDVASFDWWSAILGFASRVGSSFDVLSLVVTSRTEFAQYANIVAEFIDVINGYYPGGLFAVDAPNWAVLLFSIGHNANYATMLLLATGENITLPAHLYINFDLLGVCLASFLLMFMYSYVYNRVNVVFLRIFIIMSVLIDISNGGGFTSMVIAIPLIYFWNALIVFSYKIGRLFLMRPKPVRVRLSTQ